MNDVKRILQQRDVGRRVRIKILEGELDDCWWIDDTAVSLPESAGAGRFRLLADLEDVPFKPIGTLASFLYTQLTRRTCPFPFLYLPL